MGTLTVDRARLVKIAGLAPVKAAPWPGKAFINRPTMGLANYLAAKAKSHGGRRSTPLAPSAGLAASPTPAAATNLAGFSGINQSGAGGAFPPDINGAVSGSQIAEITNQHVTVFSRPGLSQASDISLATLTGYSTKGLFDPRILFDSKWKRWVITAEAFPESTSIQYQFIAVSKTSNANGAYWVSKFNTIGFCGAPSTNPFWDYPQLGMSQDAIVVTANCFQGQAYAGARTYAVAKALAYNGLGYSVPVFSSAAADGTLTPSIVLDQNPNMDMLARNVHQIRFTDPANAFYSPGLTDTAITGFAAPSVPRNAGQAGCTTTSCQIDTSDGRFSSPGVESGSRLWNVATYGNTGNGGFATPTWGQFNTSTHAVIQRGVVFSDNCSDDFNASIAATTGQRAWINWTSTDEQGSSCGQTFVRQFIATRLSTDPAGTFPSVLNPFTSAAELTGDFDSNFGSQRWGDTSSFSLDPSNGTIAWSWNESVFDTNNWGTRAQEISNN